MDATTAPSRRFEIAGADGPFGATLTGLDLTSELSPSTLLAVRRALCEHHVLVIENQKLSKSQYLAFGKRWGEPITFFDPRQREGEHPDLIVIHNREDTPTADRNAALHWHVDGSYEDPPASVTMLYAVEAPRVGNETLFANMIRAYSQLSGEMKHRIDGLVVEHGVGDPRLNFVNEHRGGNVAAPPVQSRPTVRHPLVLRHPQTGEKVLYAPSGSPFGIVGMTTEDGLALLRELKVHATQVAFVHRAAARSGSLLIWDNYAVMHSATPTLYSDEDGERRLLYRISTREILPL